jgi:hypothetical protein
MTEMIPKPEQHIERQQQLQLEAQEASAKVASAGDATPGTLPAESASENEMLKLATAGQVDSTASATESKIIKTPDLPKGDALEKTRAKPIGQDVELPPVSGFEKSGVVTDDQVQTYLKENLPPDHISPSKVESIKFIDKYQPVPDGNIAGRHYYTTETTGRIEIYRQTPDGCTDRSKLEGTISHEAGHNVHANLAVEAQAEWKQSSMSSAPDTFVSDYAHTDIYEDFAESYLAYQRDPELLREVSNAKYEFMKNKVFHGREYPARQI